MPVETRHMELELATLVNDNKALFNDSALSHIEHSLDGYEFALIGVSSHMKTVDLEWLILFAGGSLTKTLNNWTNYVIKGSRVGDHMHQHSENVEDLGMYKDALEKNISILTTLEFFQLLGKVNPMLSIQNLVDHWSEHITFSLRDTSAYGIPNRHMHKYSLEIAKSDRSRCHGHCHKIIPKGDVRLKACFDPLTDSFVYFRCLNCITPAILDHIEKEWKQMGEGHNGDLLLQFAQSQSDIVLQRFQSPGTVDTEASASPMPVITPELRQKWVQNLVNYIYQCASEEFARRNEKKEGVKSDTPITEGSSEEVLGKRKRFASTEMEDFMHGLPPNVIRASVTSHERSVKMITPIEGSAMKTSLSTA